MFGDGDRWEKMNLAGKAEMARKVKELGIMLEVEGERIYGTEKYALHKGDSVSFPSDIPHILKNIGREKLVAIWVITPPIMKITNG